MPILKQSGSTHGKKRIRPDITREMISAPLGDFRHTMHVGRGGDVFGDTSFLSNHGPSTVSSPDKSPAANERGDHWQMENLSSSHPHINEERASFTRDEIHSVNISKSLSQLSDQSGQSSGLGSGSSPTKSNSSACGLEDSLVGWRQGNGDACDLDLAPTPPSNAGLKHAESILSFHLDLGPSLLDDVLGVMEKSKRESEDEGLGLEKDQSSSKMSDFMLWQTVTNGKVEVNGVSYQDERVKDSTSSTTSGTLEENRSLSDEDSNEEEKHSVYEGVQESSIRKNTIENHQLESEEEEEEEKGQGYTFDDELDDGDDDEIGL
ncbi:cdc42 effector protein 5 [Protopterus annectens]|uniref:cdc42 effector protein 5 n=1 Tax=Protopterus annectens TaxID=7888 RepID=UPI001CFB77D5|nr:cdc42 effector protein 5 [Protopterus annectens]XP_043937542.1 cdc42 effector protein 5 [Protopterus annectens]XP_043937549.1 cdc42 effector protein 5 [Protopterus annectens]XP_043937556.1 cdc42 effector protein 5 [Protopterus annectens]